MVQQKLDCTRDVLTVAQQNNSIQRFYVSYTTSFHLQLAESFMADFKIFISLYTHLLKDLLLVLINILTDVTPVKAQAALSFLRYVKLT